MPTIMVIMNIVFITGVVGAVVGLCAWGIVTDRPFATFVTNWATAHSRRGRVNPRAPREAYRRRGESVGAGA